HSQGVLRLAVFPRPTHSPEERNLPGVALPFAQLRLSWPETAMVARANRITLSTDDPASHPALGASAGTGRFRALPVAPFRRASVESITADVIVIGAGIAGFSAAARVKQLGRQAIVLHTSSSATRHSSGAWDFYYSKDSFEDAMEKALPVARKAFV